MKVVILGGGESGKGAALLAEKLGYDCFLSDSGQLKAEHKDVLVRHNIRFEEGGHSFDIILEADLIIKSPGIPDKSEVMKAIKSKGIKTISEIEFGALHCQSKILAVTGSNGKTTTSALLYHVLKSAGRNVEIAGNYGYSFAGLLAEKQAEFVVLEISSFQLDDIDTFKPHISTILNITPDHLDRYEYKMEKYVASKFRITRNQEETDFFVYNGDDKEILNFLNQANVKASKLAITSSDYASEVKKKNGEAFEMRLIGKHNRFNARVVVEMARLAGLNDEEIAIGLADFESLAHRLEWVADVNGVRYINDSKATNVDSVFYALDAIDTDIIWIAGGTDKGNDYEVLKPLAKQKVKTLICLGIDNDKLKQSFVDTIPTIMETTKVSIAVSMAGESSQPGNTVLLSPACASFDLFKNYMDRGEQFKAEVLEYKQKTEKTTR